MLGYVDASEYNHDASKSERDGKFLGLPLDMDNEDGLTDGLADCLTDRQTDSLTD